MMITERALPSFEDAARAVAAEMALALRSAVAARGRASLAVSGGRTAAAVLPVLAREDVPWARIATTLTDERWVPPDHPESNENLARRYLTETALTGLSNAAPTPEAGHPETERRLARFPFPLDVVFLGMGEDGHIASIFPGRPEVWAGGLCVPSRAPVPPHPRISLTLPALLAGRHAVLMVNGPVKRAVYEDAKATPPEERDPFPLRLLLHQKRMPVTVWLA